MRLHEWAIRSTRLYFELLLQPASHHAGESDQTASEQQETRWLGSDIGRDLVYREGSAVRVESLHCEIDVNFIAGCREGKR